RQLFRDWVRHLPRTIVQLLTFSSFIDIMQIATDDPMRIGHAISGLTSGGGTEVVKAVDAALRGLQGIPSQRRFLLFVTDAAIQVAPTDQVKFEALLGAFKDAGIRSLWVGMVPSESPAIRDTFTRVSRLAGGEFIISPGVQALQEALDRVHRLAMNPASETAAIPLQILVDEPQPDLSHTVIEGNSLFPFPPSARQRPLSVGCLQVSTRSPTVPQSTLSPTGTAPGAKGSKARTETVEQNRLSIGASGETTAVRLTVTDATILSRLQGIDAGSNRRFVSLRLTLENRLPEQEVTILDGGEMHPSAWVKGEARGKTVRTVPPYLIPDLHRHLFLRWNDGIEVPVSPASVFLPDPLYNPELPSIMIASGSQVSGQVVFLVDTPHLQTASLHLYDTAWGHLDLPLVGSMTARPRPLSELPTRATGKLSDTFALAVQAVTDQTDAVAGVAPAADMRWRTIQLSLESKVQAHLAFDPTARLRLVAETPRGPVVLRLSPLTDRIPGGWSSSSLFMPGSRNLVSLVFPFPSGLASAPSSIHADLRKSDLLLPLVGSEPVAIMSEPPAALTQTNGTASGTAFVATDSAWQSLGLSVTVNQATVCGKSAGFSLDRLVVDLTTSDRRDGYATRLWNLFELLREDQTERDATGQLVRRRFQSRKVKVTENASERKGLGSFTKNEARSQITKLAPLAMTGDYLFGIRPDTSVADGTRQRNLLLFDVPTEGNWYLAIGDHVLPEPVRPADGPTIEPWFLAPQPKIPSEQSGSIEQQVAKAIQELSRRGELKRLAAARGEATPRVIDDTGASVRLEAPPLSLSWAGEKRWLSLLQGSEDQLWETLRQIRLDPGTDKPGAMVGPEALLTQQHGTVEDMRQAVTVWYAERRLPATLKRVALSESGKTEADRLMDLELATTTAAADSSALPAYVCEAGTRTWVLPFCRPIDETASWFEPDTAKRAADELVECDIAVNVVCEPANADQAAAMGDMGSALAGGSGRSAKSFQMFKGRFSCCDLSRDALDLYYTESRLGRTRSLSAIVLGPTGRQEGTTAIDVSSWRPVREEIEVRVRGCPRIDTYVRRLEDEPLTESFHSVAIAAPDISASAALELSAAWQTSKPATLPDAVSILRWASRARLAGFLAAQARYERQSAIALGVRLTRQQHPRVLIYTGMRQGDTWTERLDLRQHVPAVTGPEEAVKAFLLMHGLTSTACEGAGIGGKSVIDVWKSTGDYLVVPAKSRNAFLRELKARAFPEDLQKMLKDGNGVLLFSRRPQIQAGKPVWGWLEIDPKTFVTQSTFSTGDRGGMVEEAIMENMVDGNSYAIGFIVGIDASIWSVAAFSLEESRYEEILARGETFANSLASCFNGIGEEPSFAPEDGPVSFGLDGVSYNDGEDSSYRSFTDGYNAGVKYYFAR
ncbi:MAG TPA: hypothetical protein PKO06_07030, partial [Candidatus Ozemobacteraceae bacterium]|nr:hypothetical protein [Candidatus Ozemobacteraceae bacterium]